MYWDAVLKEVLNKKSNSNLFPASGKNEELLGDVVLDAPQRQIKKFFLGLKYKNIYFTNREAEVMVQLLQGKTLQAAADSLELSPRTIEFYVKNMKTKLSCRTKSELIGKVFGSDFVKNVDFIAKILTE